MDAIASHFYHNETRLLGCGTGQLTVVESGHRLAEMAPFFESGDFRPLPISRSYRLAVAGGTPGRIIIHPDPLPDVLSKGEI